jgi:sugar/nucleoside kinase (ribokinase family)
MLSAAGVDVRFVHARDGHTSEVVILVEPSGERAICGIWPDLLHTVPVPVEHVAPGDVVYFAAWHEEFVPAMTQLTNSGTFVATVPPPTLGPLLPVAYLIGSQDQYDGQDPRLAVRGKEGAIRAVVVTRGADGLAIYDRDSSTAYPAHQIAAVDTTGAGDAFAAGFLYRIAAGASVGDAVAAGTAWAAATVMSPASVPPTWHDVHDRIRHLPGRHMPD